MSLSHFVERRRRSLLTLLFMLIGAGIFAGLSMPVALFPDVRFPRIAITVDAGDRPVDQMEGAVTRPVEQAIRAVPGILDLRSNTSRGSAELSINFGWGSNMDLALQRVQAALGLDVGEVPDAHHRPAGALHHHLADLQGIGQPRIGEHQEQLAAILHPAGGLEQVGVGQRLAEVR